MWALVLGILWLLPPGCLAGNLTGLLIGSTIAGVATVGIVIAAFLYYRHYAGLPEPLEPAQELEMQLLPAEESNV